MLLANVYLHGLHGNLEVDESVLPHPRKFPRHFDERIEPHFQHSNQDMHRVLYFQAYDYVTNGITDRFE